MKTTDEYSLKLAELIERSARIDVLVQQSRQATTDVKLELEELRTKQRETTHFLHQLESASNSAWENIGDGG